MVFEGLVLSRISYKERDLIVKLILRNGSLGSFYVYGGQGGGKFHKPSLFEPGCMMKIFIREKKSHRIDGAELMIASEYQRLWEPQHIRHNIQAFYLTCLYFEILQKFVPVFSLGTTLYSDNEKDGVFSVVSNGLFYMNDALEKKVFLPEQHLSLFLIKLLFHLGIMPDTDNCCYCRESLLELEGVTFLPAEGQFACLSCCNGENEKGFLLRIKKGYQTRYQEYSIFLGTRFQECDRLLQYFCHHFHLRPVELKSYALLFR